MDFFSRQDEAKARSRYFFLLFGGAVLVGIIGFYFLITLGLMYIAPSFTPVNLTEPIGPSVWIVPDTYNLPRFIYGNPPRVLSLRPFLIIGSLCLVVTIMISTHMLKKIKSRGGAYVAEVLGGELLGNPATLKERQLVNVIEEMAVAAGLPRPRIYVLRKERNINAMTAGLDYYDAVIIVTQGALEHLDRAELQGVMAHELAHISNGDYSLNLKMAGWLYGLMVYFLLLQEFLDWVTDYVNSASDRSYNAGWFGEMSQMDTEPLKLMLLIPIYIVTFPPLVVSLFGLTAAELIQAAVSRQREYLADAFAVQFTRDTAGLSSALKKIAALPRHGVLRHRQALLVQSFFIVAAAKNGGWLETHPPITDRIMAIEPRWDGCLPKIDHPDFERPEDVIRKMRERNNADMNKFHTWRKIESAKDARIEKATEVLLVGLLAARGIDGREAGRAENIKAACQVYQDLPEKIKTAARDQKMVGGVVTALFLNRHDQALQARQVDLIRQGLGESTAEEAVELSGLIPEGSRLPVLSLTIAALKVLSDEERTSLSLVIKALMEADGQLDLFEIAASQILKNHLGLFKAEEAPAQGKISDMVKSHQADAVTLVSLMAYLGAESGEQSEQAFYAAMTNFKLWPVLPMTPKETITDKEVMAALDRLSKAPISVKEQMVKASVCAAMYDHVVSQREYELLKALAAALDVPLPVGPLAPEIG